MLSRVNRALLPSLALALSLAACSSSPATSTSGASSSSSSSSSGSGGAGGSVPAPPWLVGAGVLVSGETTNNDDCRTGVCRHNENTDMIAWGGAIYLVHRTAESQILGPNSSLRVSKSTDGGKTFTEVATIPAPMDRDIRDPHFYVVGGELRIKTLARLAVMSIRDSNVDTTAMGTRSKDGTSWDPIAPLAQDKWSLWRIKQSGAVYYSAAYADGDQSVSLFSSTDGVTWKQGAQIYGVSADTPLETELVFMKSKKMLALVRMDGTDDELLGDTGRLRTKVCWSDPPYAKFDCPQTIDGQRLDGPLAFFHGERLFVIARKHLQGTGRKRTALFEITGDFQGGGAIAVKEHGELPSAGDTSYAGIADVDAQTSVVSWYSGDLVKDEGWALAMLDTTDIWKASIDWTKVP